MIHNRHPSARWNPVFPKYFSGFLLTGCAPLDIWGKFHTLLITAVFVLSLGGCFESAVVLPSIDPYYLEVSRAWLCFSDGDYYTAMFLFEKAEEMDPLRPDAYLGLGWCFAFLDQMAPALSNLEIAILREPGSPDGYAAKAFIYLARNEYELASASAEMAISLGKEEYVFNQIPDVRTRNLRLLIAECCYIMGQYEDAQAQIDILDPNNGLDRDSRAYKRDLILEIESLKSSDSQDISVNRTSISPWAL